MRKGILKVNDYRLWANHGWYEEERKIGAEYRIDVTIHLNVDSPITEIHQTANYETIIALIESVMTETFKLIETSTTAIFDALDKAFPNVNSLSVTLTKLAVPITGLTSTSFTLTSKNE